MSSTTDPAETEATAETSARNMTTTQRVKAADQTSARARVAKQTRSRARARAETGSAFLAVIDQQISQPNTSPVTPVGSLSDPLHVHNYVDIIRNFIC